MQWMPPPPVPANCPPGLEYLTQIDQLLIKQQVELLEGKCLELGCLFRCFFLWLQVIFSDLCACTYIFICLDTFTAFTGFETNNKYKILNSMGQQVFFAAEGEYI